jgi:multiple sugar transport system substrate-binding protein
MLFQRRTLAASIGAVAIAVALTAGLATDALAQTKLRVFSGGANQRPDLMKKLFEQYSAKNSGITVEVETGGATSDLQRQYLSTVLNAKDPAIDIYMIDIVNPAQYYGAGWLEPLNAYVGEPAP